MQSTQGETACAAVERALARRGGHGRIMVTRVGLEFPTTLEFAAWEQAGLKIARIADSSAWCLGDWLIYGQHVYADRYRHAVAMAGLDYQTLRNYAWVARRFELSRRRERLSFQHHAEVAALAPDEQDRWLDRAEHGAWSRNELRRNIRAHRRPEQAALERPTLPRLSLGTEQVAKWREAAERRSQGLADWIVATLDSGALHALSELPELPELPEPAGLAALPELAALAQPPAPSAAVDPAGRFRPLVNAGWQTERCQEGYDRTPAHGRRTHSWESRQARTPG